MGFVLGGSEMTCKIRQGQADASKFQMAVI